jgi:hypothetical protein
MTPIEKSLTRLCPDIKNPKGQELTATIQPSGQGGELLLHWNNDKKKEGDKTLQFVDLVRPDRGPPSEWGTWIRTEDLKSRIMISPGLSIELRSVICKVVDRIILTKRWTESDTDLGWEEFLESCGRLDIMRLPIDEETDEVREVREKNEAAQRERAERSSKVEKAISLRELQAQSVPKKQPKKRKRT